MTQQMRCILNSLIVFISGLYAIEAHDEACPPHSQAVPQSPSFAIRLAI